MLARAVSEVYMSGYRIENIDSVIIAEAPKIAPYRDAMRATIAKLLKIPTRDIQIKGKTNEGLGDIGKGNAIAAQAVALLKKR